MTAPTIKDLAAANANLALLALMAAQSAEDHAARALRQARILHTSAANAARRNVNDATAAAFARSTAYALGQCESAHKSATEYKHRAELAASAFVTLQKDSDATPAGTSAGEESPAAAYVIYALDEDGRIYR